MVFTMDSVSAFQLLSERVWGMIPAGSFKFTRTELHENSKLFDIIITFAK